MQNPDDVTISITPAHLATFEALPSYTAPARQLKVSHMDVTTVLLAYPNQCIHMMPLAAEAEAAKLPHTITGRPHPGAEPEIIKHCIGEDGQLRSIHLSAAVMMAQKERLLEIGLRIAKGEDGAEDELKAVIEQNQIHRNVGHA